MSRNRANRDARRARRAAGVEYLHESAMPGETATIERVRAGTFTRWQDTHQGAPESPTTVIDIGVWTLPRLTERTATTAVYDRHAAPGAQDGRPPRKDHPFTRTVRKCEPAGPFATSTGFSTRV